MNRAFSLSFVRWMCECCMWFWYGEENDTLLSCFACHTDTKSKWTTIRVFAQIVLIRLSHSWTYRAQTLNLLNHNKRIISFLAVALGCDSEIKKLYHLSLHEFMDLSSSLVRITTNHHTCHWLHNVGYIERKLMRLRRSRWGRGAISGGSGKKKRAFWWTKRSQIAK